MGVRGEFELEVVVVVVADEMIKGVIEGGDCGDDDGDDGDAVDNVEDNNGLTKEEEERWLEPLMTVDELGDIFELWLDEDVDVDEP